MQSCRRVLVLASLLIGMGLVGLELHAEEESAPVRFSAYRSAYYEAYYGVAAGEVFEPGLEMSRGERLRTLLELRLRSDDWANAVQLDLRLNRNGTFSFSYPEFASPPKGVGMLALEPKVIRTLTLTGSWTRKRETLTMKIERANEASVTRRAPWSGIWRGDSILLDSLGDLGPMLVAPFHLQRPK